MSKMPPTPLADLPPGNDAEARAGELLRRVEEPAPLGATRTRAVLAEIRERTERPERRRVWPLVIAPAVAVVALVVILALRLATPGGTVPSEVAAAPARWLVLDGQAEAQGGTVILRSGRLLLESRGAVAHVEIPGPRGARITVRERSVVDIRIIESQVRVSAFVGSARAEWSMGKTIELAAGRAGSPDGESPIPSADAAEVLRLLHAEAPAPAATPVPAAERGSALAPAPSTRRPARGPKRQGAVATSSPARTEVPAATPAPSQEHLPPPVSSSAPAASSRAPIVSAPVAPAPVAAVPVAPAPVMPAPVAPARVLPTPSGTVPPLPVLAPAPPPASAPRPSALALEAASFERAVRAMRHDHDAAAALTAIDAHLAAFPSGFLAADARLVRVEALLALGRRADALSALERLPLGGLPRARELSVVRGELRAEAGRCQNADRDFSFALRGTDELAERALVGRSECFTQRGDDQAARASLEEYLQRFPNGRFAARARRALGR